jgi:hypothetical protein
VPSLFLTSIDALALRDWRNGDFNPASRRFLMDFAGSFLFGEMSLPAPPEAASTPKTQ